MFGLTGSEGNHGEDVKEYYFYLDSTPTHSYMKWLYKYPQRAYPYNELVAGNRRSKLEPEYELADTRIFEEDRYFDVYVEYAKSAPEDVLVRITVSNRGAEDATLHVLPTLWFRNTWAGSPETRTARPSSTSTSRPQVSGQSYGQTERTMLGLMEIFLPEMRDKTLYTILISFADRIQF